MTSGFRLTLRRMATEDDPTERERLADSLASRIETALDQSGDKNAIIMNGIEETLLGKINDIHKSLSDTNELSSRVLEALVALQLGQDKTLRAVEDGAARLGKLEETTGELRRGQVDYNARLDETNVKIGELNDRHEGQLGELSNRMEALEQRQTEADERQAEAERRLDRKRERFEEDEARIEALERRLTELDAERGRFPVPEETLELIELLRQIKAERDRGHADGPGAV